MENINFKIHGMPVPYKRMSRDDNYLKVIPESQVGNAEIDKWRKIQAYVRWKDDVKEIAYQNNTPKKPKKIIYLSITFYFNSKKHADIYNYWLNIADAIFESKKYVMGAFNLIYDEDVRSEVFISEQPLNIEATQSHKKEISEMTQEELSDFIF
jgi:hypothetical protein